MPANRTPPLGYFLAIRDLRGARDAGHTIRKVRAARFPLSAVLYAGFTLREARRAGYSLPSDADIPLLTCPYSRILADIEAGKRTLRQSTFGPQLRVTHPRDIPMCIASHFVQMAGAAGWALWQRFGFDGAAALLHARAHPASPPPSYGSYPDSHALAYIGEMARREKAAKPAKKTTSKRSKK